MFWNDFTSIFITKVKSKNTSVLRFDVILCSLITLYLSMSFILTSNKFQMRKQLNINFDINHTHPVLHLLLSTKYMRDLEKNYDVRATKYSKLYYKSLPFPSVNFLKSLRCLQYHFFLKFQSKEFFTMDFSPFSKLWKNVSIDFFKIH